MELQIVDQQPSIDHLYDLYESEKWNHFLQLSKKHLQLAMMNSWYVVSAYDQDRLIGTARVVSDGVIVGFLCGLIVHPDYRGQGIGKKMVERLSDRCRRKNLHLQVLCENMMIPYYEHLGFQSFAVAMYLTSS